MAVFISYASRDRSPLEGVRAALRRAQQDAWSDEQLGGGDQWWQAILEQIRSCEVFVFALSNHSLEARSCQAELRYALALGKPVLPVQIGPVDSIRGNPLAVMQVIDYRNPSVDTGIELISAVHALQARNSSLPHPLPDEPPAPFEYLARLTDHIAAPTMSAREQVSLLAELAATLEEDGSEDSVRHDVARMLSMLRDRPDVTYRTRTEVDALLSSLKERTPAPPPDSEALYPHVRNAAPASYPLPPLSRPPLDAPPYGPPVGSAGWADGAEPRWPHADRDGSKRKTPWWRRKHTKA
jgi:hypothetical protein